MMATYDWHALYRSLTILSGFGKPVPLPTVEQLDQFESNVRIKLPQSYKDYILVFGPGSFPCILNVAAPGYQYLDSTYDLTIAHARYGYPPDLVATSCISTEQKDRLSRLYFFGLERGRMWLGWDLEEGHEENGLEYAIYRVDGVDDGPEYVASSFGAMVETVCDHLFTPNPEHDEVEMGPQRGFQPAMRSC